ncbi:hypothetical protein ENBRE01_1132 [Enteropsectra breve]|nr:hypothetical protein ENBRE01_1132 [Enteropsectra breve]
MERTSEFCIYLEGKHTQARPQKKECFYNTIYANIVFLKKKIQGCSSYSQIMSCESELVKIEQESSDLLESIAIEGTSDIQMHYKGIKYIISSQLRQIRKDLERKKNMLSIANEDLEPEKPRQAREMTQDLLMEQENRKITQHNEYESVQRRLHKIGVIQRSISENLVLQEERIDSICLTTGNTGELYDSIANDDFAGKGSILRRILIIILISLSFILLYLHYFYR